MRANVYSSYTVVSRWLGAVYGALCMWRNDKHLTDGVGFEPTVRYERTHTFQACALNHSATRPIARGRPLEARLPAGEFFCR